MTNSHFANPHGLNNPQGYSCAEDLAKLCSYAMRNGKFRKVVQTKRFEYWYTESPKHEEEFLRSELDVRVSLKSKGMWENTNKMLGSGWSGIKTGITPNAGPCLAACVDRYFAGKEYQFLVILLDSESMEARWEEAQNLVDWAILNRLYV
jgi:D-alanyl-D-alanine carboxypeptidase